MLERRLASALRAFVDHDEEDAVAALSAIMEAVTNGQFPNVDRALELFKQDQTAIEDPELAEGDVENDSDDDPQELDFEATG